MELLTVFWVDAAGTWTLRKVFASKVRITTSLLHFAKGCYSLSHPWALRQCKSPKWDPIYTILYDGSHIPPLLPFHLKITSPSVKWVTTTQIKTQGHLICTYAMVNCDSYQRFPRGWPWLWEAAGDFCSSWLHVAQKDVLGTAALGHVLLGTFSSHIPLSLRRQHMGQTQPWIRTFTLHLAWVLSCTCSYLVIFPSTLSQITSHSPRSVPLLAYGMEWITQFLMKTSIFKSCLMEEDYSDLWDKSSTTESEQSRCQREKTPNI